MRMHEHRGRIVPEDLNSMGGGRGGSGHPDRRWLGLGVDLACVMAVWDGLASPLLFLFLFKLSRCRSRSITIQPRVYKYIVE